MVHVPVLVEGYYSMATYLRNVKHPPPPPPPPPTTAWITYFPQDPHNSGYGRLPIKGVSELWRISGGAGGGVFLCVMEERSNFLEKQMIRCVAQGPLAILYNE